MINFLAPHNTADLKTSSIYLLMITWFSGSSSVVASLIALGLGTDNNNKFTNNGTFLTSPVSSSKNTRIFGINKTFVNPVLSSSLSSTHASLIFL